MDTDVIPTTRCPNCKQLGHKFLDSNWCHRCVLAMLDQQEEEARHLKVVKQQFRT